MEGEGAGSRLWLFGISVFFHQQAQARNEPSQSGLAAGSISPKSS
jgi:hypothetical protein